jgi:hypothetical protein
VLGVELALAVAALAAGLTGTWSPCGFSMVESLGRTGAGRVTVAAACSTFALGAVVGGVVTFGALAAAGRVVHGLGGGAAAAVAAAIALAAAVAEARGIRIVPQIRRQVPEPWRRRLPLPLAAVLYGALLGLGFTTFVLTYGVWALAALTFVLGDVRAGVVTGIAFGVGRALPVAAIAPLVSRPLGVRLLEAMAERPRLLRGLRVADAAALFGCAIALAAGPAVAATVVARGATDPTVAGDFIAWDRRDGALLQRMTEAPPPPDLHHRTGLVNELPRRDPALGGSMLAAREGNVIHVQRAGDLTSVVDVSARGADALAVSDHWLAYRVRSVGGNRIVARRLQGGATTVARVRSSTQLGRPSLHGQLIVFHVADPRSSRIVAVDLASGRRRVLRRSRLDALTNPAVLAGALLYVRQTNTSQLLHLGPARPGSSDRDRVLLRVPSTSLRDSGYEPGYSRVTRTPPAGPRSATSFWTTALARDAAYLTLLPRTGDPRQATIVRVPR